MTYDLLIKNARVVDGSGEPSFQADVAVHQGRIVGVGRYNGAAARRTIDAGIRMRAVAMARTISSGSSAGTWASGVPSTRTSMLIGTLSGCGSSVASW